MERILVQHKIIDDQVDKERIAPGGINYGQGLYLGQVDVVLGEDVQDLGQAALVVPGHELDRGLVLDVFHFAGVVWRIFALLQYEESRRVVLDRLDVTPYDLQPEEIRCSLTGNRSNPLDVVLLNPPCHFSRIFFLDQLYLRMIPEKGE